MHHAWCCDSGSSTTRAYRAYKCPPVDAPTSTTERGAASPTTRRRRGVHRRGTRVHCLRQVGTIVEGPRHRDEAIVAHGARGVERKLGLGVSLELHERLFKSSRKPKHRVSCTHDMFTSGISRLPLTAQGQHFVRILEHTYVRTKHTHSLDEYLRNTAADLQQRAGLLAPVPHVPRKINHAITKTRT